MYTGIVEFEFLNDYPKEAWDEDWSDSCVGTIETVTMPYEGWALYINF